MESKWGLKRIYFTTRANTFLPKVVIVQLLYYYARVARGLTKQQDRSLRLTLLVSKSIVWILKSEPVDVECSFLLTIPTIFLTNGRQLSGAHV